MQQALVLGWVITANNCRLADEIGVEELTESLETREQRQQDSIGDGSVRFNHDRLWHVACEGKSRKGVYVRYVLPLGIHI